jgi:hypothetical protein
MKKMIVVVAVALFTMSLAAVSMAEDAKPAAEAKKSCP